MTMKTLFSLIILFFVWNLSMVAQENSDSTKGYQIEYVGSNHGKINKRQPLQIVRVVGDKVLSTRENILQGEADYPYEETYIDWSHQPTIYKTAQFSKTKTLQVVDTSFVDQYEYEITDETKEILGYTVRKAVTSVNSNTIELWFTNELPFKASPVPMGEKLGVVLEYARNGASAITAQHIKPYKTPIKIPEVEQVDNLTYQDELWKSRFIQIPVFDHEQVNFVEDVKSDRIFRFANGTVIVKKVKIPKLKPGTQGFIQVTQRSLGDAYDRTGSVFMMLEGEKTTFFDGMQNGIESLPGYENGNDEIYRGMVRSKDFEPAIELMRFFTPFGVDHFNDRVQLKGKTWQDSTLYRQEITDFRDLISGQEVYIGAFIGNYDAHGHELSLELTFHPGWGEGEKETKVKPLFNTTSEMEMGGQGYPTMFNREKGLKVKFTLDEDTENVRLRYITTGHGGWGGGDEFNPKKNTIYLDGEEVYHFTPWREDCGSYRLYNPVSGNFQNGLSSSDLSRSNWCPATVTNPEFIDLGDLKAGDYTLEVDIPQGESEGSSFSYWNVSGVLIYE